MRDFPELSVVLKAADSRTVFVSIILFVLINDENWSIVNAKRRKQRKEREGD